MNGCIHRHCKIRDHQTRISCTIAFRAAVLTKNAKILSMCILFSQKTELQNLTELESVLLGNFRLEIGWDRNCCTKFRKIWIFRHSKILFFRSLFFTQILKLSFVSTLLGKRISTRAVVWNSLKLAASKREGSIRPKKMRPKIFRPKDHET